MLVAPSPPLPVEPLADAAAQSGSAGRAQNLRDPGPAWRSLGETMPLPSGLRAVALSAAAERARRDAARAETERDRLQRALAAEQEAHRLAARRAAVLDYTVGVLSAANSALLNRTRAVEQSTAWRLTGPMRSLAERFPRGLVAARRAVQLVRSAAVPGLVRRLRERKARIERRRSLQFTPDATRPLLIADSVQPRDVALPDPATPLVTVIIPTFGKPEYTLRCLASIAAHPPEVPIEVIVIDDASHDLGVESLTHVRHLRLIVSEVNRGFIGNCNEAAKHARGEFLLLLNNDTQVLPGWLDTMIAVFRARPDAGAVGSKLIYPDGRLQEAGCVIWRGRVRPECRQSRRSGQARIQLCARGGLLLGRVAARPPRYVRGAGRLRRDVCAGLLRGRGSRLPPARAWLAGDLPAALLRRAFRGRLARTGHGHGGQGVPGREPQALPRPLAADARARASSARTRRHRGPRPARRSPGRAHHRPSRPRAGPRRRLAQHGEFHPRLAAGRDDREVLAVGTRPTSRTTRTPCNRQASKCSTARTPPCSCAGYNRTGRRSTTCC